MNHEQAFLEAIAQEPDDDGLRLIYADWLEDAGGPESCCRAEFIRVQLKLASLPEGDAERAELLARARALRLDHEPVWL